MQFTPFTPIIINPGSAPRDCIIVDSHKYCRDVDVSHRDVGLMLLMAGLVAAYIILAMSYGLKRDSGWITFMLLDIPFFAVAFWLTFS